MQPPSSPAGPPPAAFPPRPPPPRPPTKNASAFVLMLMLALGSMVGATCTGLTMLGGNGGDRVLGGGRGPKVGVVELVGPIMASDEITSRIRDFAGRDDLVALVLRIDSPGGAVAPSQEIYSALRDAAAKKPVVASMGNVAASGGFWVSLGADWVFAAPGTITGSIGVINQSPDLTEIAELLHFKMRTYKSGPLKDVGNPFRPATPADAELLQGLIDDIYGQFTELTAERRGLSMAEVRKVADGRIMTGRAALEADLVDELGSLWDAARKAVLLAEAREAKENGETVDTSSAAYGSVDEPTLVYPREPAPKLLDLLRTSVQDGLREGISGAAEDLVGARRAPVELR